MKIALVAPLAPSNEGIGGVVGPLAAALSASHDVTIVSAGGGEALADTDVRHLRVPTLGRPGSPLFELTFFVSSTLLLWWARWRARQPFDIVHHHHHGVSVGADVTSAHCCERWNAEIMDRSRREHGDRPSDGVLRRLQWRLWTMVEAWAAGRRRKQPLIVSSEGVKRQFTSYYASIEDNVHVVPNGVDASRFSPANAARYRRTVRDSHGLTDGDLVVLTIAIDWVRKGITPAIEAMSYLEDLPAKLLVVGPDDPGPYRAVAADWGVWDNVVFAGPTSAPWGFYGASDVFLLASVNEPFGLVVLEAMASGVPIVVSASAGVAELIEDGRSGLFIHDSEDAEEIAARLRMVLCDGELGGRLACAGRQTALRYDWYEVASQTVEVYRAALSE